MGGPVLLVANYFFGEFLLHNASQPVLAEGTGRTVFMMASAVQIFGIGLGLMALIAGVVALVLWSIHSDADQRMLRWVSLAVVAVGFSFDLLTS